ncbi:hypothetical protein TREPR_3024 [Treponema primitia ZAS-2]|uniref:Uncharacterized protein n=1 Tax=Treponema primitia (strain ATCC BAA-887 / DSM 12427 / ZAS-2) TaxID=545694 RepID=F5YNF9_TREPZ|nr:hypothetical protein [Treponema primitia]AEF83872.1 hypothetical protein TREPR_3024 [Treponema primitia ZAS-2]
MATILATTALELSPEKKKEVIAALGVSIGEVFKTYSLYFQQLSRENVAGAAVDQTTFYVFVPPYMEVDRRRTLIKKLHDTMVAQVGNKGDLKNIVIFKYHDDEACGVDGILRSDAKAAAAK